MKKKPCEFCEVEQFITINGKDAQMSIEFYPDKGRCAVWRNYVQKVQSIICKAMKL